MPATSGAEWMQQVIADRGFAGGFQPLVERLHRQCSQRSSTTGNQQIIGAFHKGFSAIRLQDFADLHLVAISSKQATKNPACIADRDATTGFLACVERNRQRCTSWPDRAKPLQFGDQRVRSERLAIGILRLRCTVPDASKANRQPAMAAGCCSFLFAFVEHQLDRTLRQ